MKIPKFLTILIVNKMIRGSKRIIKKTPFESEPSNIYDIYYTEKNVDSEAFDLYRRRIDLDRRITLIDIHGGAYAAGFRKSQFYFVRQFQDEGMDVLCPDYTHTGKNKNISVETQIKELVLFLNYLDEHFEELDLSPEIYLMGDSAGGHFVLLLTEIFGNMALKERFGLNVSHLKLKGTLVNCPVYRFEDFTNNKMKDSAKIWLFGGMIMDETWAKMISPSHYTKDIKVPVYISSSDKDFLMEHSKALNEDLTSLNVPHQFTFIEGNDKAGHVHNVINLALEDSRRVNKEMIEFILNN